jgi:integrase
MVRAELMGRHSHRSTSGTTVHISFRDETYLARGRFERKQFGKALGKTRESAEVCLRQLLSELDSGSFIPPRENRSRPLASLRSPLLTFAELADRFLAEKRKLLGQSCMRDYLARLEPALEFLELKENRMRYPLARDLDRNFALDFKVYVGRRVVTRNGKTGGKPKPISERQVQNVMETVRSALNWGRKLEIGLLPLTFANPVTREIVGEKAKPDPFREQVFPLADRVRMADKMDCWELCTIGLAMVLPARPEELCTRLISDVDWGKKLIRFGTGLGGVDFTKSRTKYCLPITEEMIPLLRACIDGRSEGPLLCKRAIWDDSKYPKHVVNNRADVEGLIGEAILKDKSGSLITPHDRKKRYQRILTELGGMKPDDLRAAFLAVRNRAGISRGRLYDLRHAVSTDLNLAGVRFLEERFLTGHETNDIMNDYVSLDPHGEFAKYIGYAKPLFEAVLRRGSKLGCLFEADYPLAH